MLEFFPFVGFLAIATSIVALTMLFAAGELGLRTGILLAACAAAAGYAQFFASSTGVPLAGLLAQTMLAISLVVRWRLTA